MTAQGYMHIEEQRIKKYEFTQKGFSFDESIVNISDLEKVLSNKTRYIEPGGFKTEKIIDIESHKSIFSDSKTIILLRQKDLNRKYIYPTSINPNSDFWIGTSLKETAKWLADELSEAAKNYKK